MNNLAIEISVLSGIKARLESIQVTIADWEETVLRAQDGHLHLALHNLSTAVDRCVQRASDDFNSRMDVVYTLTNDDFRNLMAEAEIVYPHEVRTCDTALEFETDTYPLIARRLRDFTEELIRAIRHQNWCCGNLYNYMFGGYIAAPEIERELALSNALNTMLASTYAAYTAVYAAATEHIPTDDFDKLVNSH